MDQNLFKSILKNDFPSFVHKVFNTINPSGQYYNNWHIDLIAEYLREVEKGNIKRLIINIPPRSLKSVTISVAWPAWLLGQSPATRIMVASYSQILSTKLSLDTKFILSSEWYQGLFPHTQIHPKQNQKNKFMTTEYGFRFATSVGGSATGEGGDILLVDDPHNPTQVHSEKFRQKTINWFLETFSTRLNNRSNGKIVIIMQRLHEDDLAGFLLKNQQDEWKILKIPVLAHERTKFVLNNFSYVMGKNETLHKELFTHDSIKKLVKEIGNSAFKAQYLQSPDSFSSGMLKYETLKFYTELPSSFDYVIQSWDTAIKTSEESDFSACTTWGVVDNCFYLISVLNHKYEYPFLKKQVIAMNHQFKPYKILIEDKASGHALIQDLKLEGYKNIVPIKVITDKITRFATIMDLFEDGRVFIPSHGYANFIVQRDLLNFPNCKNDDIVDSITQFLNYIKNNHKKIKPKIRGFS